MTFWYLIALIGIAGIAVSCIVLIIGGRIKNNQSEKDMSKGSERLPVKIVCPICRHENCSDTFFCSVCGKKLQATARCPECGTENPIAAKFCSKCGTPFSIKAEPHNL